MKNKLAYALLCSIIILGLIGCGQTTNTTTSNNSSSNNTTNKKETKEDDKKELPIKIEQLPLDIKMREPDSIGSIYMDSTYTNNTSQNIIGYSVTVLLKDANKTTYLSCHDTVLPGEVSPKFNSSGPKTKNIDDVEILKYEITIVKEDGSKIHVDYDNKLKQYNVY